MTGSQIGRRGLMGASAAAAAVAPERSGGLAAIASRRGLIYGCAVRLGGIVGDPDYAACVARECAVIVPEMELKWGQVSQKRGEEDYSGAERDFRFARAHGMAMRGHTLIWHGSVPGWLEPLLAADPAAARAEADAHIAREVAAWRGRLLQWDVVNEALDVRTPDGFRDNPLWRALGQDYVSRAFKLAREADPATPLAYNDYDFGLEAPGDPKNKIDHLLRLLERSLKDGAPISVLGVQSHIDLADQPRTPELLRLIREVRGMGLRIMITELDVSDATPASDPRRDRLIADAVTRFVEPFLADPATIGVLTWGLSDRYTWLNDDVSALRKDGESARGLPLDWRLRRKPFWTALARAFEQAPPRAKA